MLKITAAVLLLCSFIILSGCDSATDSKATDPTPPTLLTPADGDTNVSRSTTFTWSGTADVLWLDVNSSFNNHTEYSVSGTSFTVPAPLNPNTYYYWQAGRNVGGRMYWSQYSFHFRTGN
ncbi:MAG: hypothetical protein IT280_11410 [Ignavibacteria bacterium]|nr:hypothetical protein [Ignavibacteria bacterium]